jgi:hypothetical protein
VNPHGDVIPPAGSADPCDIGRLPTTSASNAGFNPDGFFLVGTRDANGTCGAGDLNVELFSCDVSFFDEGTGKFGCLSTQDIGPFDNGTLIKYTEAEGAKTPTVKPMGSNNGSSNPNGGAVAFKIKASGDLEVCSAEGCELCLVPPPPKENCRIASRRGSYRWRAGSRRQAPSLPAWANDRPPRAAAQGPITIFPNCARSKRSPCAACPSASGRRRGGGRWTDRNRSSHTLGAQRSRDPGHVGRDGDPALALEFHLVEDHLGERDVVGDLHPRRPDVLDVLLDSPGAPGRA